MFYLDWDLPDGRFGNIEFKDISEGQRHLAELEKRDIIPTIMYFRNGEIIGKYVEIERFKKLG